MFPDVDFVSEIYTKLEPYFILHKNQKPKTIGGL